MKDPQETRPILVFGYGNPSRGDDALGPLLLERLRERLPLQYLEQVELLTDFQLQVEHALDLQGRGFVVFADASASGESPFSFAPVAAERDVGYTTHAMSPGAVLSVFERVIRSALPSTWLLAIRGYEFALGQPCTRKADRNLHRAAAFLAREIRDRLPA